MLLILVGVTLNIVTGNNGILGKAKTSADKTKEASAKEQVELKIAEFQQEFYEAVYVNTDGTADVNTPKGKWIADQTKDKNIETEDYTFEITGDNAPYTVTIKKDKTIKSDIEGSLSDDGILRWKSSGSSTGGSTPEEPATPTYSTLFSQITEENYGDYVSGYNVDLGIASAGQALSDIKVPKTDWRIFYKDETNVYLIASDYLPTSKYPANVFGGNNGQYNGYWSQSSSDTRKLTTSGNVTSNTKFLFTKLSSVTTTNKNYQAVATLLDTSKWSTLADAKCVENKETAVIGSPTVEMWMASWNKKYKDTLVFNADSTGYKVGLTYYSSLGTYISDSNMQSKVGFSNTLYYPHGNTSGNKWNSCSGYWLASPSALTTGNVMLVRYSGIVGYLDYDNYNFGVRPTVSLKSDIQAEKNAEGVWEIK